MLNMILYRKMDIISEFCIEIIVNLLIIFEYSELYL